MAQGGWTSVVKRSVTGLSLTGVNIHRPRDRVDMSAVVRSRTPSTNLLRTLMDLGAVTGDVGATVRRRSRRVP